MTTFTDKELIKEIKERIGSLDVRDNIERRAYEIALTALTAEPFGIIDTSGIALINDGSDAYIWLVNSMEPGDAPLYIGLPRIAPASIPEAMTEEKAYSNVQTSWQDAKYYATGWNACRAAMLQGVEPASNHEELSEENGSSLQLRNLIRQRHAEWSDKTFGCVGPVGPLKHLSKEALEAAAEPDDLSEWADMQFLLWDAQRRAGISDAEITAAMEDKLKINMERQWPEPKDGEPRLHIKEPGNSPVIPDVLSTVCAEAYQVVGVMADALGVFGDAAVQKVLDNLSQQKLVHRDVLPFSLPVTPDGWISCSDRMPNDKQYVWCWGKSYGWTECDTFEGYYDWSRNKWWAITDDGEEPASKVTHWMPLPEPPQEVK